MRHHLLSLVSTILEVDARGGSSKMASTRTRRMLTASQTSGLPKALRDFSALVGVDIRRIRGDTILGAHRGLVEVTSGSKRATTRPWKREQPARPVKTFTADGTARLSNRTRVRGGAAGRKEGTWWRRRHKAMHHPPAICVGRCRKIPWASHAAARLPASSGPYSWTAETAVRNRSWGRGPGGRTTRVEGSRNYSYTSYAFEFGHR
ncbi:hypothetical protein KM043_010109 [Ampulex compressa]|nr:hypothetical protein KM043_010109 [Ampulex compressa]